MERTDLRIISRLVHHYRNEVSCLTTGEHRGLCVPPQERPISESTLIDLLTDLTVFCEHHGWDIAALLGKRPPTPQ